MQGGKHELTRAIIVSLAERGYVRATGTAIERRQTPSDSTEFAPVEQTVYDWLSTGRTAEEVFGGDLPDRVGTYCLRYEERLQQERFVTDESYKAFGWKAGLLGGGAIVGIGGLRLLVGLVRGEPTGFLVNMGLVSIAILVLVCSPSRLTARGQAYIERLKKSLNSLGHSTGSRYALVTAILGVSGLAGTPYEAFGEIFKKAQSSSSGGCGARGGGSDDGGGGCGGCGGCS
jgi:uncharacterized protein (TIGR04222 family)